MSGGKRNQMSRLYEVMFIVRPDAAEEDVDKLIAGFTTTVTNGGGTVKATDKMGRRKLAYSAVVAELERRLRVSEPVIKFITVRIDEEEKRLAKVRAIRASRRKLSAEPREQAAPPQAAAPQAPAAAAAEPAETAQASA
jgi:small subunit ribosomal protein S6